MMLAVLQTPLNWGAEGVFLGSRFIPTVESPAAQSVKQMIVDSSAADLLLHRTLPAYYRSLLTPFAKIGSSGQTRRIPLRNC
ncbi:Nitronate monooxygenase [compost metagenome]